MLKELKELDEKYTITSKLQKLDRKYKMLIIIAVIAVLVFGVIDRLFDNGLDDERDGDGRFWNRNQIERRIGNDIKGEDKGGRDRFGDGGGAREGAAENFFNAGMQLAIVAIGTSIIVIYFKPKSIKEVKHTILGAKRKVKGEMEDEDA